MTLIKPKALGKGSTIGLISPANHLDEENIAKGVAALENMGFNTRLHPQNFLRHHRRAGTAEVRGKAINEMFADPEIDGIMCLRGGSGFMRVEPWLDYNVIHQNPKVLCGNSDITLMLQGIQNKTGLVTFHGPMFRHSLSRADTLSMAHFAEVVGGNKVSVDLPTPKLMNKGKATGKLVGGNLALLSTLIGTPEEPDMDGAILFFEEVGEEHFRLDRNLWHLKRAGKLENIAGVMLGEMISVVESDVPYGITIWDSVMELFADKNIPIVGDAPIGHGDHNLTLPLGLEATLNVTNTSASLTLEEGATDLQHQRQAS